MTVTEREYHTLKDNSDKEQGFSSVVGAMLNEQHSPVDEVKQYVASMLLRFAVLDKSVDMERFLLNHGADPRIKDKITDESALTCALESGDFNSIKIFSNFHYTLMPISGDYTTIGSIYSAITSNHDGYDTQDLLGALSHLYLGIAEVF